LHRALKFLAFAICAGTLASAHIGSPDVYFDGFAGPYKLFVTLRPPLVIPGVLGIEVRSQTPGVSQVKALPLPISESGTNHSPTPDSLPASGLDHQFFTGSLWLMADGSWKIKLAVSGSQGSGVLFVPVPAVARATTRMQWPLGAALGFLGIFLVVGLVAIAGASVREARLAAGVTPGKLNIRNGRNAMYATLAIVALLLWGGKVWWDSEAAVFQGRVYKPLSMHAELSGSGVLDLRLREPGWMQPDPRLALTELLFVRRMDDLVPDHNHLMHLYAIRQPGLDVVYHLHPDLVQTGEFRLALPEMPAGTYQLYADIVHENGLPETLTATLAVPTGGAGGRPLAGDDARGEAQPVDSTEPREVFILPDGYRMKWVHDPAPLRCGQGTDFRFELLAPDGAAAKDMALYMGMLGHAAFVKTDGTVFAHIHPNGSVPMAAIMRVQETPRTPEASLQISQHGMPGMDMALPNEVSFPYGLPSPGKYRVFVQMKHGETVETGIFDLTAI
jgi:hypothetical protein